MVKEAETFEELMEQVTKEGGIGLVPTDNGFRIAIGINPQEPNQIFEQLNDFENSLIRIAANDAGPAGVDLKIVEHYSNMVDNIRTIAMQQCEGQGINVSDLDCIPQKVRNEYAQANADA